MTLHQTRLAFDKIGSTSDHAKDLARQGAAEGTVVSARTQTGGRGRRGNVWTSPPGNLYMSLILRPSLPPALSGQLSFLAAVALHDAVAPLLPSTADIRLKWPNDLLINGRKAGGILIEAESGPDTQIAWAVVGIGLNLRHAPDGAASLTLEGAEEIAPDAMLDRLMDALIRHYQSWRADGFAATRAAWLAGAWNLNARIAVRLPDKTLEGVFLGLDDNGALLLQTTDNPVMTISSGEVFGL